MYELYILEAEIKGMLSEGVSKASTRRKRNAVDIEDESFEEPFGGNFNQEI